MQVYTLVKGDTLWMIAKRFGVSLEDLIKANPQIKDPNKLVIGDEITIPLPVADGNSIYTVQSGDTMWSVAKKFGVALNDLLAANPEINDADSIQVGQKLVIPGGSTSCNAAGTNNGALYYVKSGDTLFHIAQRYAVNPQILAAANPQIPDTERLKRGSQLYLPGFHYVKSGETLYAIADFYDVTLEDLLMVNPQLETSDPVAVGEKLAIPRQESGDIATYTVGQGDTLYKISQKYNVSVEAILNSNHEIIGAELIYPCQKLQIPGPYLIQKGQTLAAVAALYDLSLSELLAANPQLSSGEEPRPQTMVMIPSADTGSCRESSQIGVDYTVQSGDTADIIAGMYRVPLDELLAANPSLKAEDEVSPGMVLRVPTGSVDCVCYTIQRQDSIWEIAARYGLSADDLLAANPRLDDGDEMEEGQILMIPIREREDDYRGNEDPAEEIWSPLAELSAEKGVRTVTYPEIYVVQKGDSLFSIAKKFGTEVKQLRLANVMLRDSDKIYPGQQLIILPKDLVCEYRCLECPWLEKGLEEE